MVRDTVQMAQSLSHGTVNRLGHLDQDLMLEISPEEPWRGKYSEGMCVRSNDTKRPGRRLMIFPDYRYNQYDGNESMGETKGQSEKERPDLPPKSQ